ncbi:V-type ATP synthase subunit C [anaerobic digester metagenome]|jgi:V/A-type H+-transporting ATPase subunit C
MELSQIIRFIGESGYHEEVHTLSSQYSEISLIEHALTANLAATYRNILSIAPGALRELAELYFSRWDIENVMLIMRGCQFHIPDDRIEAVLIPAGVIEPSCFTHLLTLRTIQEIAENLPSWKHHSLISSKIASGYRRGLFAELENDLYLAYYQNLLFEARYGIRGGDVIVPHLKFEIDIFNIRNVFRLRAGSKVSDITPYMIQGGYLSSQDFQRLYQVTDREEFVRELGRAGILSILTEALRNLRCDESVCEADAADVVWRRWAAHKTPLYTVMLAVNGMLLHHLDGLSRRHPFSVLPLLSYLEHKRYEVMNLRAIARGKQFGVSPDFIRQHLVM